MRDKVKQAVSPDSRLRVCMFADMSAPQGTTGQVGLVFACSQGQVQLGLPEPSKDQPGKDQPGKDQPARRPVAPPSKSPVIGAFPPLDTSDCASDRSVRLEASRLHTDSLRALRLHGCGMAQLSCIHGPRAVVRR